MMLRPALRAQVPKAMIQSSPNAVKAQKFVLLQESSEESRFIHPTKARRPSRRPLRQKQDARSACGATTPGWHRQSIRAETATQNPCTPRGCITGALCISRIRLITHVRTGALGGRFKICLRRSTYQKHGAFDVQLAGRPYRSCHRSKQGYRSWNRAPFRVCWLFCSSSRPKQDRKRERCERDHGGERQGKRFQC